MTHQSAGIRLSQYRLSWVENSLSNTYGRPLKVIMAAVQHTGVTGKKNCSFRFFTLFRIGTDSGILTITSLAEKQDMASSLYPYSLIPTI